MIAAARSAAAPRLTLQIPAFQPRRATAVERLDLGPGQARHVVLDRVADLGLHVGEVAVALGEAREQLRVELELRPRDRPGPRDPSRRSAGAARAPSGRRGARGSRRSARCTRRRTRRPRPAPRCEIVILVCAMARSPATSTELPPRKWRIRTPRSKPSRLTRMNSSAGPWNQVAIILPSSCQTVRKRSQSPASRQTAQFSISSRISSRSRSSSLLPRSVGCHSCGSSRRCGRPRPGRGRAPPRSTRRWGARDRRRSSRPW